MGRRKQPRPHRSVGTAQSRETAGQESTEQDASGDAQRDEPFNVGKPFFVEVDRSNWDSSEHFDISELLLTNLNVSREFWGCKLNENFYQDTKYSLRIRLCNVDEFLGRMRLGHWPVLPASDIYLEFVEKSIQDEAVIVFGGFDGPDEGVTALVHLANLKFLTLRPVIGVTFSEEMPSLRVRVEMLKGAFDACDSLLDTTRQLWKKSLMNVMSWVRPEVMTSEARYGCYESAGVEFGLHEEMDRDAWSLRKQASFDAAGFYEAIKPSKENPMLEDNIPDLLPKLRPYQRRAAYWMVQREKGASECSSASERSQFLSALCVPLKLIDTCSTVFYNPFSGNVSLHPERSSSHVFGGILADEMGLGKTVELLACIFAHQKPSSEVGNGIDDMIQMAEDQKANLKRLKRERIECICGAVSESSKYKGLWVQCDNCDAWQHADCVGYSTRGKTSKSREASKGQGCKNKQAENSGKRARRNNDAKIVDMDGDYICQLCSELIQATHAPIATGASLIVCPAPILQQWHAEIIRHTNPGSLKTCVYEGVQNRPLSNPSLMDISELVGADIILTTYDVLKDDLSHDTDRHEGDRRIMRFQKRYPVFPTFLTRIYWWRVCLDEAQMVEISVTAATEMALRLHAKHRWCISGTPIQRNLDDLYGLLRFLKACPFDVQKWWIEVIRDPYERGDIGAMQFTHKFFKQIMWRSSKRHVADELQLPPQEESLTWLSFSPIEEHFYQRQHETCVSYAREVIEGFKDDILKQKVTGSMLSDAAFDPFISQVEAAKLLNSLLKLRQACCHPQVGSSGLRSLQQAPMTMDEILSVLIGKTKVEGEEALRKLVVALNGLAGIAVIKQDFSQAALLYREALGLAKEHSEDFRMDPLLNIHIHHNLAEILPLTSDYLQHLDSNEQPPESSKRKASSISNDEDCVQFDGKRSKLSGEDSDCTFTAENLPRFASGPLTHVKECDQKAHRDSKIFDDGYLRTACENLKEKFLSVFNSKLSLAQQEFRKSHLQVCKAFDDRKNQHIWWLEALHHIEQNKDSSSELIRKIGEAISSKLNVSRTSKIASCFRSTTALKYYIQTGLDSLEDSRKTLLDRLVEIDKTMENPREEDIERVRYCPNCQPNVDGLICVHCELDELFQVYEARLFRLNKAHDGEFIISVEAAVEQQKRKSALNRFYWALSRPDKNSTSSSAQYEDNHVGKRDVGEKVVVSRSPSELEVVLGIVKNFSKALLGRDGTEAASKQLMLLEGMRKEYAQARSLAIAQAQVLRAHDEIKMATSRLRLQENDDDKSIDALSLGELEAANVENSSDKFLALTTLSRIKGQLRYLKGLIQSKQKIQLANTNCLSLDEVAMVSSRSTAEEETGSVVKADEETCPVCQEKLQNQKMVFQCGHITCCKCFFAMTEKRFNHHGKLHHKWVMCPTCRQHTDFGNIAFADDGQNKSDSAPQGCENIEACVTVHGSYGTKIEAITKRILWISSTDPKAKLLVFSSWNDVLDVLEHAFTANSISYIRMKGGRKAQFAISHFKGQSCVKGIGKVHDQQAETSSVRVLLLLIQHGANGLNLLEAQHVILVEPLLNPAAEAQAVGRVHRIGQEKKTIVHHFIVKNTVEESIYKLNRSRAMSSCISGNTKNHDQRVLTLKDAESLFAATPSIVPETEEKPTGSLMHLPPAVAAAIAAEKRLKEQTGKPS